MADVTWTNKTTYSAVTQYTNTSQSMGSILATSADYS